MIRHEDDKYFQWLCAKVKGEYYSNLLDLLYSIPFTAKNNDLDTNRISAAIKLRDIYERAIGKRYFAPSKKCTFLEMMIGLAIEMDDRILYEDRFGDRYLDWFWYMVDNMGLSNATDDHWSYSWVKEVTSVCSKITNGHYAPNGEGGLFPVYNHPEADMRNIDIWRQAFWWIEENLKSGRIE